MSLARVNATAATGSRNRISDVSPSGICAACLDGCPGFCEVAKSGLRGREMLYPQPYGEITAGAQKQYPVDYSHLNIQGSCVGAYGTSADPDRAVFNAVNIETEIGTVEKMKLKAPIFTGALGSTDIARVNWEHLAAGAAISGILIIVGENVCGMDPDAEFMNGKVVRSPELKRRIDTYKKWYEGYGGILVQHNVEDGRIGTPKLAIDLGADGIEIKWGQGAKDIGGEVKLGNIERAKQLKQRGYIVFPDPDDPVVESASRAGGFREFERHSRLGMVSEEDFCKEVEELRKAGAKFVTLKTGAYRSVDLARAIKYASEAKIDLLTIDGAGGGTGMSPWRMMNEWGIPTIYLQSLAYQYAQRLDAKGAFVPDLGIAGGFSMEDHVFKALAMGAPYFKGVCMGRATMIPAMVGKNVGKWMEEGSLPKEIARYGDNTERIFEAAPELMGKYKDRFTDLPLGAVALYGYCDRIATGLRQLMAGARKFSLPLLSRNDLISLTEEATKVTGISYVMDSDKEEADKILG